MRLTSSASWRRGRGSTGASPDETNLGEINRLRPLIELNAGSPWVGDESNPDANVVDAVASIGVELDAGRFQLGDECFQILHIETDVIEDPALGRPFRNTGLGPAQLHTGEVGNRRIVEYARLGAEDFAVPGLALGDRILR